MKNEKQKERLLEATIALLEEASKPEEVTSRQIAKCAGINVAMINYYFGSKDTLMEQAVSNILDLSAQLFDLPHDPSETPKKRLRTILRQICKLVLKYHRYIQLYIPHVLLEKEITLPHYILPEIRAHFEGGRDETECRMVAYELVSFLQIIFCRRDAFERYAGLNPMDEESMERILDLQMEMLLPEVKKE